MKKIIIVESPAKSKTIESYLGSDYTVLSSLGHIRDLAISGKDGLGIDIENGFIPNYVIIKDKDALVKNLIQKTKNKEVFLATDPDREGEAIAFHLAKILDLDLNDENRVVFNEITKPAIIKAFNNPRKIDTNLVSSQETRRMLDRIIGFKMSNLLKLKIRSKSAGRVQSVALLLICELEKEILAFIPITYYELESIFDNFKLDFVSYKDNNKRIEDKKLVQEIYRSLDEYFICSNIETKELKRESKPAYITSTLQQDASNKLNFSATKTMRLAQSLYEGKNIGSEEVGLITYMRTDSTHLSDLFVDEAFNYITKTYGSKYKGRTKVKDQKLSQGAHEAIRPTSISKTPSSLRAYLTSEEYKLYNLIYNRTIASLMTPAIFENTKVTFINNETTWKTSGQRLLFDGYLLVYGKDTNDENNLLPEFFINKKYKPLEVKINELETKPKNRYTESTLIKEMEEQGIGRPSTYAQTLSTLVERRYVSIDNKKLIPSKQGMLTNDKLIEFFSSIINVKYTAEMEDTLDKISKGEEYYLNELNRFYSDFQPLFINAKENMKKLEPEKTGELCPVCNSDLVIRNGKYGEFVACGNYPSCKYIKQEEGSENVDTSVICPTCKDGHLIKKIAKRGMNKGKEFYACSNYPKCKTIYNDEPTTEICPNCGSVMVIKNGELLCGNNCLEKENAITCPVCNSGHLVKRFAKRGANKGKEFYACSNYPKCKAVYNILEEKDKCSDCSKIILKANEGIVCAEVKCIKEN